jgi:hypothetical protein
MYTLERRTGRHHDVAASTRSTVWLTIAFYSAMAIITIVLAAKWEYHLLPQSIATHVSHNSEVFNIALLVVAAVETRRRLGAMPGARAVLVSLAMAGLLLGVGFLLIDGPVSPTVKMLNEASFAGAALWLYVFLPRPLRHAWLASVVLLVVVVVGYHTSLITLQAECMVALILAPISFDVVDRGLLDPAAPASLRLRIAWLAFLLLVPVVLMVVKREDLHGVAAEIVKYPSRGTEGFWGMALVHGFYLARDWLASSRLDKG